jgi:hypothetical protein
MRHIGVVSKYTIAVLWRGFRSPLRDRKGDLVLAVFAVLWIIIRTRNLKELSWGETASVIVPIVWLLCLSFFWHVLRAAYLTLPKSLGRSAWTEFIVLIIFLLCVPIGLFALTYPNPNPSAPRHLTRKQKNTIIAALSPYKGQLYAIDYVTGSEEAQQYAADFEDAFRSAGWSKANYGPLWAPTGFPASFRFPNQYGVQWYISEKDKSEKVYSLLAPTLRDCCGIVADGVRWPDPQQQMDTQVIYFYVGPKYLK